MRDRAATHGAEERRTSRWLSDVGYRDALEAGRVVARARMAELQTRVRTGSVVGPERDKAIEEIDGLFRRMARWL